MAQFRPMTGTFDDGSHCDPRCKAGTIWTESGCIESTVSAAFQISHLSRTLIKTADGVIAERGAFTLLDTQRQRFELVPSPRFEFNWSASANSSWLTPHQSRGGAACGKAACGHIAFNLSGEANSARLSAVVRTAATRAGGARAVVVNALELDARVLALPSPFHSTIEVAEPTSPGIVRVTIVAKDRDGLPVNSGHNYVGP